MPGSVNEVLNNELIVNKYRRPPRMGIAGEILMAKKGQLKERRI